MSDLFRTPDDYETFIYTLAETFPVVVHTTLVFVRVGSTLARISGEVLCQAQFRLLVRERVSFERLPLVIDGYGYEVWQATTKLYWYDSQPHPHIPDLQSTHPHHKHIPPDIKHHRVPAPGLSFTTPNLPLLLQEIEALICQSQGATEP